MSDAVWYRSLYWRIGLGFVLFLASVLIVQGTVLFWLINRSEALPGPPPRGFLRLVAFDLGNALEADPDLDVQRYIQDTYRERAYPFFILMTDGRVASSVDVTPSSALLADARARLDRMTRVPFRGEGPAGRGEPRPGASADPETGAVRGGDPRPGGLGGPRPDGGGGRGRFPVRFGSLAGEIVAGGRVVGMAADLPVTVMGQFGPTMAVVGGGLVIAGTMFAALLIFGPVHRRLRSLEDAARRVGAGDLSARAREDGGDEVAGLATAFNRMTSDLNARDEQLQEADRARRMLLADVSHELRTPLTAMRGYLETLSMSELSLDADTRTRYVSIIGDESRRLERIVGDLLDLAKLEGGGDSLDRQDVPIEDLFGRVVGRHEREASVRQVTLTTAIEPGAEIVPGDPLRLEQALQNLAANALRHTPPGGRVELRGEIDGDDIVLSIRDSGPGIAKEHLPFVFERFYKADPSRAQGTPGSGLGLSIVKAIVERHGGTVSVRSDEGQGAIFSIRLPGGGDAD